MADLNVTVYTTPYGIVGPAGADGVLSTSGVITYNGFTGAVQGVSSWNGQTGALQGVCTWNGLTGALQGVCTWNGLTGDVTGVTTGVANNFKALQSFSNGISASGGITFNGILNIGQMLSYASTDTITIGNMAASTVEIGKLSNSALLSVQGDAAAIALIADQFSVTATDVVFNNSNITGKLVTSLNGKTGSVGLSAGINIDIATVGNTLTVATTSNVAKTDTAQTFTALQNFASGISASGGMTLAGTLDTTGNIKFIGTTPKTITTTQAPLSITGVTSGAGIGSSNSVVFGVQTSDPLKLYSTTGVVEIKQDIYSPYTTGIKLFTLDNLETNASVNIAPSTYFTADRTLSIPDDSGTIALTKNVVTSLNGKTGALQGVCAINGLVGTVGLSAGTGILLSTSGNTISIINTASSSTYIPDLTPLGITADVITMRSGGWTLAPINTIATPLLIFGGTALPGSVVNIKLINTADNINLGTGTWFYTYMRQQPSSTLSAPHAIIDNTTTIVSSNTDILIGGIPNDDLLGYAIKLSGNTSGVVSGGGLGPL